MVIAGVMVMFPALSWALAVRLWLPLLRVVVSRDLETVPEEEVA